MTNALKTIGVGLAGFGYWGPNLARNFMHQEGCRLLRVCDLDAARRKAAQRAYSHVETSGVFEDLINDPAIDVVLIATPVGTHHALALAALRAGKDVLVEKPLASTTAEAEDLVETADAYGRILGVDHTFLFTGAVREMKSLIDRGEIGDVVYFDSVRINLGLFQHDVNVIYDLAPHDLSILLYLFDDEAVAVQATGLVHGPHNIEAVAHIGVDFASGLRAHSHVNWFSPVKIRKTLIAGTKKMIVYDDLEASEKVKVYDKNIVLPETDAQKASEIKIGYRVGDMLAPNLSLREALDLEAQEFLNCVRNREKPISDGRLGLRVVRLLEASQQSLADNGARKVVTG